MKRLHYLVALSVVWFFLFYNAERLVQPLDITPFVYVYSAACAILVIFLPGFHRFASFWLIPLLLVFYLILKRQFDQAGWPDLPIVITELSAITITLVLVASIRDRLQYFQEILAEAIVGQTPVEVQSFGTGQGQIYREVRRARRHQRPVSLLALSAEDKFFDVELSSLNREAPYQRFLVEVQRDFTKKYINTRLARMLIDELEDSAVITQLDDHFVTLLPETGREEAASIAKRLKSAAEDKLGIKLKLGVSTFPDQAVTFESMLEQAEADMMQQPSSNGRPIELITAEAKKIPTT